jgi:hypothetical protein
LAETVSTPSGGYEYCQRNCPNCGLSPHVVLLL